MIQLDLAGVATVQQQLAIAQLTPSKQRKLLVAVAREALKDNKARVKQHEKVTGSTFKPRSQKEVRKKPRLARKKMLIKLGQKMTFKNVTDSNVLMGWKGAVGYIAGRHQMGDTRIGTVAQLRRSKGRRKLDKPATSRQAEALIELGYKARRANGRGFKTVSKKWIKDNMTVGKAGAILKSMRGPGPQSWNIKLPARPAFGFADADLQKYINIGLDQLTPR